MPLVSGSDSYGGHGTVVLPLNVAAGVFPEQCHPAPTVSAFNRIAANYKN